LKLSKNVKAPDWRVGNWLSSRYATKNQFPATKYKNIIVKAHVSGHVWCRVTIENITKDVCPGDANNKPGIIHFTPISDVKKWNWFISFWAYWGSAYVNYMRLKELRKQ
jgi:hypothetical protein